MSIDQITPLAPAYWLLFGAFLILAMSPIVAARLRYNIVLVTVLMAGLTVLVISFGAHAANEQDLRVLVEWLGQPALVLVGSVGQPLVWTLLVWLLAVNLAWHESADLCPALDQTLLLMLSAAAYGLMLAGSYRTLAPAWLVLQVVAALFFLAHAQSDRAVARLLLGVLGTAAIMLGGDRDLVRDSSLHLGDFFLLIIYLQLGLYPLLESAEVPGAVPAIRLAWTGINLLVGVYIMSTIPASWIAWPAAVTSLLHGLLAWLESSRERALAHAAYCLIGGLLVTVALGNDSFVARSASVGVLMAWLALSVTCTRLGSSAWVAPISAVSRYLNYLPPLLASLIWLGIPLSPGWAARVALYRVIWNNGGPFMLAVVSVGQGAALSVLYRYWRSLAHRETAQQSGFWQMLAASLATFPWLIPWLAEQVWGSTYATALVPQDIDIGLVEGLSLAGVWLWLIFLGHGRDWVLKLLIDVPQSALLAWLRAGWLCGRLARTLDVGSRVVLRVRVIVEGEHYLAWAIVLTICLVIWALANPFGLQP